MTQQVSTFNLAAVLVAMVGIGLVIWSQQAKPVGGTTVDTSGGTDTTDGTDANDSYWQQQDWPSGDPASFEVATTDQTEGFIAPPVEAPTWSTLASVADRIEGLVMTQQKMSPAGLAMLKQFEGFSELPYPDHKGFSIGYGHLIKAGENLTRVTPDQALQLLAGDIDWAERAVRTAVKVPMSQNQFDSLVSFAFNVGEGAFKSSTMVRKLNAGDTAGAAAEFGRWINASEQVNAALVARRDTERRNFEA